MDEFVKRYIKIKNWITSYGKFDLTELNDNDYYFTFEIWLKGTIRKPITLNIRHLKKLIRGRECLIIGFHWIFDPHPVVESVITDPIKTKKFQDGIKKAIDLKKYRVRTFGPKGNIETISVSTFLDINTVNRDSLYKEIFDLWLQHRVVIQQLDKASGRREFSNPSELT